MHFLKKSMLPWIATIAIGATVCAIGVENMIVGNVPLGIIMFSIGSIFIGSGAFIVGRISALLLIERTSREQREALKRKIDDSAA